MPASNYVTVSVSEVVKETEKAFLFLVGDEEVWVPKACVADAGDYEEGMEGDISVSVLQRLCDEKGIPYEEG